MTKKHINKLANEMLKEMPWHYASDIQQDLNYLNDKGMIHPPHDDTFLWDKEILEQEYPNIIAQIRKEEREKVIQEVKDKINEVGYVS